MVFITLIVFLPGVYSQDSVQIYLPEVSDEQLRVLAVTSHIIPETADAAYVDQQMKLRNTVPAWIAMDKTKKAHLLNELILDFSRKGCQNQQERRVLLEGDQRVSL